MRQGRTSAGGPALALFLCLLVWGRSPAFAQDELDKAIKALGRNDVIGYIQPIANFMGANMSAGWYHSAAIPQEGFNMSFNIIAMGSSVGDDEKTYTRNAPWGPFQTATAFGGQGTLSTDPNTGFSRRGSDGAFNTSIFPLGTLQLRVGSFYGTELIIRGLPIPKIGDSPSTTYLGFGARHSISQYIPESPADIAGGLFYTHIAFGDLINMKSFSLGAQASKAFSVVEVYGGLAYEKSSMDLGYTTTNAGEGNVSVSLDGANTFRGTLGLGLNLAIFHLYGDVNLGSVTNYSAGIGFGN